MRGQATCPRSHSHTAGAESMLFTLFMKRARVSVCLAYSRHSINISLVTELCGFWHCFPLKFFFFLTRITLKLKQKLQARIGKWSGRNSHRDFHNNSFKFLTAHQSFQTIFQTCHSHTPAKGLRRTTAWNILYCTLWLAQFTAHLSKVPV